MALQVQNITRKFKFKNGTKPVELSDPNPSLSPEEVLKFYAGTYPELTNGVVEGPKVEGGAAIFTISTKAGKLG